MSVRWRTICILLLACSPTSHADEALELLKAEGERDALAFEERVARQGKLPDALRVELQDAIPKLNRISDRLESTNRARLEALTILLKETAAERDRALKVWEETTNDVAKLREQRRMLESHREKRAGAGGFFDTAM